MTDSSSTPPHNDIPPLSPLIETRVSIVDHLLIWALRVPWWSVILGLGILYLSYTLISDEGNRNVLEFLADRPSLQTDELFDVAYQVEEDVIILNETVVVRDLDGNRIFSLLGNRQAKTL